MPLLFSMAVHHSLEEVHQQLEPGEELMAFLDDTYIVSEPDLLAEKLFQGAGIRLHEGKTRPADTQNLGPDVWSPDGIKILGTPLGCAGKIVGSHVLDP